MRSLNGLFGRSPFEPLIDHARKVHECVAMVRPVAEAIIARDAETLDKLQHEVSRTEFEADQLKDRIRHALPKRYFLPVNREDVARFLAEMDKVADEIFKPNGLCFSPDYKKLYVADTGASHYPDAPKDIKVWDVVDGKTLADHERQGWILLGVLVLLHFWKGWYRGRLPRGQWRWYALSLCATAALVFHGAWLGGRLVYGFGLGVGQ